MTAWNLLFAPRKHTKNRWGQFSRPNLAQWLLERYSLKIRVPASLTKLISYTLLTLVCGHTTYVSSAIVAILSYNMYPAQSSVGIFSQNAYIRHSMRLYVRHLQSWAQLTSVQNTLQANITRYSYYVCIRICMFVCGGVLVRVYTVSPTQPYRWQPANMSRSPRCVPYCNLGLWMSKTVWFCEVLVWRSHWKMSLKSNSKFCYHPSWHAGWIRLVKCSPAVCWGCPILSYNYASQQKGVGLLRGSVCTRGVGLLDGMMFLHLRRCRNGT